MSNKKYLKGFRDFKIFPITDNTATTYAVGVGVSVPYAQSLSKNIDSSAEPIYADDEIYDIDQEINGVDFTLTVTELPASLRAQLEGGTYDSTTKEYDFATTDSAPEFACTYRGLLANGEYKMFREYRAKVSKITENLNTKGSGNRESISIEGKFMGRAYDNKLETTKIAEDTSDLTWLDTIPAVPDASL